MLQRVCYSILFSVFILRWYLYCFQNGSQVMTIVLTGTELEVKKAEKEISELTKTREAAELLSRRAEDGKDIHFDYIFDRHHKTSSKKL